MFVISSTSHGQCMMVYCWWARGLSFQVIALGAQYWLGYSNTSTGRRHSPLPATDAKFLGPSGAGRSTAPCWRPPLHAKWEETSIPVPEEILKRLALSLPDAASGWTIMCHIPPHAFKMSTWGDFTPLCDCEVLLQRGCIPQHLHHTQSGFSGQCSSPSSVQSLW